jgi:hypothetical protein
MLVWKAMLSIPPMMSAIFFRDYWMLPMVLTNALTVLPPLWLVSLAPRANSFA